VESPVSGTNEAEPVTNALFRFFSGRPILSQYAICSGVILVACLINSLSISFEAARHGENLAAWKPYVLELSSWTGWSVTFAALLPWEDKVAGRGFGLLARIAIFLLTSPVFSLLHIMVMAGLRFPLYALAGGQYHYDFGLGNLVYEYRKDLLTLFLAVGLAALWRKGSRRKEAPVSLGLAAEPAFLVPSREGEVLVRAGEIDWIEAQGNYVALHVRGQERLLRQPLKEIEAKLADMAFIRTHRSALVNMRRVKGITRTEQGESRVEFDNRDSAPLSASRRAEVVRALATPL
jgi:hypothetical protein